MDFCFWYILFSPCGAKKEHTFHINIVYVDNRSGGDTVAHRCGRFPKRPGFKGGTINGSKKPRDAQHHRSRRVAALTHEDRASGNLIALDGIYCDSAAGAAGDLCDYG